MLQTGLSKLTLCAIALMLLFFNQGLRAVEPGVVNFAEIHSQALFAEAAYRSQSETRALLESNGYALSLYKTIEDIQMTFFLATSESEKTQLISLRGTSNVENAMVDIALKLLPDDKTGVRLHQGFSYAARRVYAELKPLIRPQYKIHTTGHSLGGAVAQILAMYLDADGFKVEQVVTFGQPKVTNLAGASRYQHLNLTRVVTDADLVPLVPPFDPLDLQNLDIYWHAGREVVLLEGNQYAILEDAESMLRATRFTRQPLGENNLKNHYMRIYLGLIKAKIKSSERVRYRNNLNIFNLFGSSQQG